MKQRIGQKRAQLYLREYPRLLRQVRLLVQLVETQDPNVAILALYGSTSRLEPRGSSDSDLLILLHDPRVIYEPGKTAKIVRILSEVEDEIPLDEWCAWTFSGIVGDSQGGGIDPEFLENVGAHGVLLYRQAGVALPPALAGLQPFDAWLERVNMLLADCARAAPEFSRA